MARFVQHLLSGWGNFPREEVLDFRPDSPAELPVILNSGAASSYISRGLGRSYGDAALNAGAGVIRHERLNRFLAWDPASGTVEAESGVSYADLLDTFVPRGFFPPVTPGTRFVTLGGALAADVHGKNHHRDGNISEFVESFTLLTGTGQVLTCSRQENADVFWATVGGMGLTGAILTVKLRLRPIESAYVRVRYQKAANLDQALEGFTRDAASGAARYSVAWIDCLAGGTRLGRSVLMLGDHAPVDSLPPRQRDKPLLFPRKRTRSVPLMFPGFVLNSWSVRIFNCLYYGRHRNGEAVVDYDTFFYPLDSVRHWNRIYGKRGFVQYQMVVPHASSRQALIEILEKLSRSGRASFLAVLKTFGPANPGLLSFPTEGTTLALDLPNTGPSLLTLLNELDRIVLEHGGRVYLAKDARLSRSTFETMYPRANEFRAIKQRLDPKNRFSSSLARRLGLCEPAPQMAAIPTIDEVGAKLC